MGLSYTPVKKGSLDLKNTRGTGVSNVKIHCIIQSSRKWGVSKEHGK